MYFNENEIARIKDAAKGCLLDVAKDFHTFVRQGVSYICDCPHCGASKKFSINPDKDLFGCFSCHEVSGSGAISYLMKVEGKDYTAALEYLANRFNVLLDERPEKRKNAAPVKLKKADKKNKGQSVESYCAKMLAASGLTVEDVTANVYKSNDHQAIFQLKTFRPGTIDAKGAIVDGDDVIIEYYDLDGLPVTYYRRDARGKMTNEKKEYYRVRWQFPEEHLDKEGKPFKYKSPAGSGTPIYIPERLRKMFKAKTEIPRLYIQEGEKKAEAACKWGIPSIAVSGIQNLGMRGTLPEDVVRIISECHVKEVAFIFDSDWDDISSNIRINDQVEKRPRNFFFAAKNFKEYMRALKNRNIYVEIFVGHMQKNDAGDKGLDDILANSLQGRETELAEDIEAACNDKQGVGKWVEMFKVTTWTDHKLQELWSLQSHEEFAARHKDILQNLPEFVFGRYRWKFENDKVVLAQPFDEDEKFWEEEKKYDRSGNERTEYNFLYLNSQYFLMNRGFGRLKLIDGSYRFIHLENPVVRPIEASDARDYLLTFAKHNCKKAVVEMLIKGIRQYVGPDKLQILEYIEPNFIKPTRDGQYFYFAKNCWYITADEVKEQGYESITHHIWEEQKKNITAKYLGQPLITFTKNDEDESCSYQMTEEGKKCHFLRFLENTSNFTWRKDPDEITGQELNENAIHLLSKMCAIGFMAMEAKDNNVARAIIGMDGKQSEVGESNGRSGKSLVGELMRQVVPTAYINGKKSDIFNDQFVWNDVMENTKMVFMDDVMLNFNFEMLFPCITGDWTINYKGGRRITIPFAKSAKIYIATNHTIRGNGSSFRDRQWLLAFSDYYNDNHKPIDDFGCLFFSEWDFDQWNLCWNMLATCIQLYLKFGVVQAPGERLEQRRLRQEITEALIAWADEYYSDSQHINNRIPKKELYEKFIEYDPAQRKFISATLFKKKLQLYCTWKGYTFNPNKYDRLTGRPFQFDRDGRPVVDDKSGGIEYVTVGNDDYLKDTYIPSDTLSDNAPSDLPFPAPKGETIDY